MWFLNPFLVFSIVGAVGIFSLLPLTIVTARKLLSEDPEIALSETTLGLALLLNPLILLLAATAVGSALADRVGLRSVLLDMLRGRGASFPDWRDLALAVAIGLAVAAVIILLQMAFEGVTGDSFARSDIQAESALMSRVSALLYGGITEEIIVRFGLMTLLMWLIALVLPLDEPSRTSLAAWFAIGSAALIFGIGHLPLAAAHAALTPTTVAAIVGLNAIGGIAYGWLYWRSSLELAMLAHMATHVGFWTFGPVISLLAGPFTSGGR